jgi:hypothetical protein
MDTSEPNTGETPDFINPGFGGGLLRLPAWFRNRPPGEPLTPEQDEELRAAVRPLVEQIRRASDQYPDRQAVLAALPEWMYRKLPTNEPITAADLTYLRSEFAVSHPDLAARIDPGNVVRGWRYGRWVQTRHGGPTPVLPPRSE